MVAYESVAALLSRGDWELSPTGGVQEGIVLVSTRWCGLGAGGFSVGPDCRACVPSPVCRAGAQR